MILYILDLFGFVWICLALFGFVWTHQVKLGQLAVRTSIRQTHDDPVIDHKHNPPVLTTFVQVHGPDDDDNDGKNGTPGVPCVFNQVLSLPWQGAGKAGAVATPQVHLEVLVGGGSGGDSGGKGSHPIGTLALPLSTVTAHAKNKVRAGQLVQYAGIIH